MAFTLNRRLSQLVDSNGQINTGAISNTITAGQNTVSNSGKLTIAETYGSGSYSGSSLIVKVYFGDGDFAISKTT